MLRNLLTILLLFICAATFADGKRVALVIGNQNYNKPVPSLTTPEGNAKSIAAQLKKLNFELIGSGAVIDVNDSLLQSKLVDFYEKCKGADIAILYYSGHGGQLEEEDMLIPTNATLSSESGNKFFELKRIQKKLKNNYQNLKSIIIYDACRNDLNGQYSARAVQEQDTPSLQFGSHKVAGPLNCHAVFYAVEEGKVALDNGVFTQAWLDYFKSGSNIRLSGAFELIQSYVTNKLGSNFKPCYEGDMNGSFFGPYTEPISSVDVTTSSTNDKKDLTDKNLSTPLYIGLGISYPFSFQPTIGLNLGKEKHGFVDFSIGSNFKKTKEIYYYNTQGDIVTEQRYSNLDIRLRGGYMWNLPKSNKFRYGLYGGYDCLIITGKFGANVHSPLGGVQIEYSPIHWLSLYGNAEFAPAVSKAPANNYKDIETLCPEIKDWTNTFGASFGVKFNIPTSKR